MAWRDTGLVIRIGPFDAKLVFFLGLWLFHWRWWTFEVAVGGVVFFAVIEWFGLTLPAAFRTCRRFISGNIRPAVPNWNKRRFS